MYAAWEDVRAAMKGVGVRFNLCPTIALVVVAGVLTMPSVAAAAEREKLEMRSRSGRR